MIYVQEDRSDTNNGALSAYFSPVDALIFKCKLDFLGGAAIPPNPPTELHWPKIESRGGPGHRQADVDTPV